MNALRFLAFGLAAAYLSVSASANETDKLVFNGSELHRISNGSNLPAFRSHDDPDFVQTVTIQAIGSDGNFSGAVRALVARAKSDSHGAKLKMLERPTGKDVMVVYLADLAAAKVVYKAERLSGNLFETGLVSISYAVEFEPGNISDEQEAKVKTTAVEALAGLDKRRVESVIHTSQ